MFTPKQYRAKATEYAQLAETAHIPENAQEFRRREQSYAALASNEEWLANNFEKTLHSPEQVREEGDALVETEEQVLRCLGAAVITQWNTIPQKLQRELCDNAGSMGQLLQTSTLRGQIARFLHKHKDGG
jgi:hypothetical protein